MLTRRQLLKLGASAGALAVGGAVGGSVLGLAAPVALAKKPGGGGGGKPPPARNPLYIPPTVTPVGSSPSALTAAPSAVNVGGHTSSVLAYNNSLPGPTFEARKGETARISLNNLLDEETTVHWHGMIVAHEQDGHPRDTVATTESRLYSFPLVPNQRATLNWYHPHPHTRTGVQVALGLAGAFIIRDDEEDALGLPSGPYEVPLIIRDAKFDRDGDLVFKAPKSGFLGDTPLVNGTLNPKLDVDAAYYRFRVLNGANARVFRLALSNGDPFLVIGNDGGLLPQARAVSEIEFSGGERLDLLVDLTGLTTAGDSVMLRAIDAGWDLLEFVSSGNTGGVTGIPTDGTVLSTVPPLTPSGVERDFSFDGMNRINGQEYDFDRTDFQVPLHQTELWRFTTRGNAPHPVHIHGAYFQVVSRTGGRGTTVFPWEEGWKDTVLLQDGETVEVLTRFDDYTGEYLMHCHKLSHEDAGMMLNFVVGPPVPE